MAHEFHNFTEGTVRILILTTDLNELYDFQDNYLFSLITFNIDRIDSKPLSCIFFKIFLRQKF